MEQRIYNQLSKVAFYLWEQYQDKSALGIWYCAEDLICFLEKNNYLQPDSIGAILKSKDQITYIHFVQNIAYRFYVYTGCTDAKRNWYSAENLLRNKEWVDAMLAVAQYYKEEKEREDFTKNIRSEYVKAYYYPFKQ